MGEYAKRLDERIRRLRCDQQAIQDWRRLKIEIEKRGGRWVAENGIVFLLRDGVIYQYLADHPNGISQVTITSLDTIDPFVAELSIDLQGTPPDRRANILHELTESVKHTPKVEPAPITIQPGDWLSKISLTRWKTIHWQRHLRPTKLTLEARRRRGKKFNPDLIFPGDTFEIT